MFSHRTAIVLAYSIILSMLSMSFTYISTRYGQLTVYSLRMMSGKSPSISVPHSCAVKAKPVTSPPSIVTNVHIDDIILDYFKNQKCRLRKTRLLLSTKKDRRLSVDSLRTTIEYRFPLLKGQPYRIAWKDPTDDQLQYLSVDHHLESLVASVSKTIAATTGMATVAADKPTLQLLIRANLDQAFPPNTEAVDPLDSDSFSPVSFYRFSVLQASDLPLMKLELEKLWRPLGVVGRVYLSQEGVNAQLVVPSVCLSQFKEKTRNYQRLFSDQQCMFNVDSSLSKEEYVQVRPFRNLHIRLRPQLVADGLLHSAEEERKI